MQLYLTSPSPWAWIFWKLGQWPLKATDQIHLLQTDFNILYKFCMSWSKNYSSQWVKDGWMDRQIIEWTVRETEGNALFSQPHDLLNKGPGNLTSSTASENTLCNTLKRTPNKRVKQEGCEISGKYLRQWLMTKDPKMTVKLGLWGWYSTHLEK